MGQEDELTVSGDFSILPQQDDPLEDKAKAVDSSAEEQPDASQPAAVESSAAAPEAVQGPPAEDKTELAEASSPAAAAAAAAGSRAASEGRNQKAGTSAAVPAAAAKPLVVASGSDAAQVMTAGSAPSVALVYSGSGLGEWRCGSGSSEPPGGRRSCPTLSRQSFRIPSCYFHRGPLMVTEPLTIKPPRNVVPCLLPADELTESLLRGPFGPFVKIFMRWRPPKWMLRSASALILSGQVISRIAQGACRCSARAEGSLCGRM